MIFISYSRADLAETRQFVTALRVAGVECWLDELNIPVGEAFVARLGEALMDANAFLLIDTSKSRASYWVWRETRTALRYRKEGRYHSLLCLCGPDYEASTTTRWDRQFRGGPDVAQAIATFLESRRQPSSRRPSGSENSNDVSMPRDGLGEPSNWVGRQDSLRVLDDWWLSSAAGAWIRGMGGIGKTGLVQTWITALGYLGYDSPVSASVLHLRGRMIDDSRQVLETLATWVREDGHEHKLIFVDGHDEAQKSSTILDTLLTEAIRLKVRALVTARGLPPHSISKHFAELSLKGFSRGDSLALLDQLGLGGNELSEIAEELDDHPLALQIFSGNVTASKSTPAEELKNLRCASAELASGKFAPRSIRSAIADSVQRLTAPARSLLETLAVLDLSALDVNLRSSESLRELVAANFVTVDHLDLPRKVAVHPLIQAFIKEARGN